MEYEHPAPERLDIRLNAKEQVSGLLLVPDGAKACLVLAHGAGAGMSHAFMTAIAAGLHERGVASLRYQFAYMEKGSRRPDGPALAHAAVRAAVHEANLRCPDLPLFAGGKSFGGRMTSQAQADAPLANVRGVVFLGFPLHPANKPSIERARHLFDVRVPMLFLQGRRDALADSRFMTEVAEELGAGATLIWFPDADHSFHVPARSGQTDEQVRSCILDGLVGWMMAGRPRNPACCAQSPSTSWSSVACPPC
jgi:predicted alpha/beta-hydrolase family hydrolase